MADVVGIGVIKLIDSTGKGVIESHQMVSKKGRENKTVDLFFEVTDRESKGLNEGVEVQFSVKDKYGCKVAEDVSRLK